VSGFLETGRSILWGALGLAGWAIAAVVGLAVFVGLCKLVAGDRGDEAAGAIVGGAVILGALGGVGYGVWRVSLLVAAVLGYEITLDFRDLL